MINLRLYIIVTFIGITIVSCTSDKEKQTVMNERLNLPTETGKNIYITYTDSGFTKAKIFAPIFERYTSDDRNETVMQKGITAYFYNKNKQVDSFLKSKYAIRYEVEKKMIARDDVVLVSRTGDTLNTEELIWDEIKQRIHSDKAVRITTKDEIIMGDGFESNTDLPSIKYTVLGVLLV